MKTPPEFRGVAGLLPGLLAALTLVLVSGCSAPGTTPAPASGPKSSQAVVAAAPGQATAPPPAPAPPPPPLQWSSEWKELFNHQDLAGWEITDFAGHGEVQVEAGQLRMEMGAALTGVRWTNDIPKMSYEVQVEVMRVTGSDFFCGLTFPVDTNCCSLIVGGWGGGLVGISSLDGNDASMNETTKFMGFESQRWYTVRVRVRPDRLEAWIDDERIVNVETTGRRIGMRPGEIEMSQPFGIATWVTTGAVRSVKVRSL